MLDLGGHAGVVALLHVHSARSGAEVDLHWELLGRDLDHLLAIAAVLASPATASTEASLAREST